MAGLLATILGMFRDWHRTEFWAIRNSVVLAALVFFLTIVPGAFLGGVSETAKFYVIYAGIWLNVICLLWLAWRRLPISAEIATAVATAEPTEPGVTHKLSSDLREGVHDYVRLVASILASEVAAGVIALYFPAHQNPPMALLLLPAAVMIITYAIWHGGVNWWPRIVYGIAIALLAVSFAAVLLPQAARELASYRGAPDVGAVALIRGIEAAIRGSATPYTMFWVILALLVARSVVAIRVRDNLKPAVRKLGLLTIAAIVTAWFIWGAGWSAVAPHVGAAPAAERQLTVALKGSGDRDWVDIAQRLPEQGVLNWDTRGARNPWAKFNDGSTAPLHGDLKGKGDVHAVKGEGVLVAKWKE